MQMTTMVGITNAWTLVQAAWQAHSLTAAETFVASLWQSAVVACALAVCIKFGPRISAAHRFALWASGFVVAACLPFLPLIEPTVTATGSDLASSLEPSAATPWIQLDARWSLAIVVLWALASIIRSVNLVAHLIQLRKLWRSATPIEVSSGLASSLLGSGRPGVEVCAVKTLERPSVIGFFAPRILIPDWLLVRLTQGELEQIVLHEAEHLRRRDDWTNFLQKLWLVVFPLNPALWWMESRLCREREMACDEGVVSRTHAPRAYAACLASMAERGLERRVEAQKAGALSLGAWQKRSELVHRAHGILLRKRALSPIAAGSLLGALGCGLVVGAVELAQCPQLIAFVPTQHVEEAKAAKPTPGPGKDEMAKSITSRSPVRVSGYYALEAKAVVPAARPAQTSLAPMHQPVRKARAADDARVDPSANEQRMAKATMPDAQENDGVQQWIVFTTWEQVQTGNAAAVSDYRIRESASSTTSDGAEQTNSQLTQQAKNQAPENRGPKNQAPNQITIMQLIFRVLPQGSMSPQPAPLTMPGGWFVIQL